MNDPGLLAGELRQRRHSLGQKTTRTSNTMPELLDLKIFDRVVSTGSLSAAGRELQISPPVISKRMSRLEEQLGARLLQRTTRRLTLTEVGEGYHERVVQVLLAIDEAASFISGAGEPRGVLHVSAPTAFGRLHIAPKLKDFMEMYPDVELKIDLTDELVDLIANRFDVVVRVASLVDSTLVARRLAPCRRVFCATPGYLEKYGEPRELADLDRHRVVAASAQPEWRVDGPKGEVVYRPRSVLQTNSAEVIREAIVSGLGIGMHSTWNIGAELKSRTLKRVLPQYTGSSHVGLYAIYPGRRLVPTKVRAFVDYLAELYGPEPYWDRELRDADL